MGFASVPPPPRALRGYLCPLVLHLHACHACHGRSPKIALSLPRLDQQYVQHALISPPADLARFLNKLAKSARSPDWRTQAPRQSGPILLSRPVSVHHLTRPYGRQAAPTPPRYPSPITHHPPPTRPSPPSSLPGPSNLLFQEGCQSADLIFLFPSESSQARSATRRASPPVPRTILLITTFGRLLGPQTTDWLHPASRYHPQGSGPSSCLVSLPLPHPVNLALPGALHGYT